MIFFIKIIFEVLVFFFDGFRVSFVVGLVLEKEIDIEKSGFFKVIWFVKVIILILNISFISYFLFL